MQELMPATLLSYLFHGPITDILQWLQCFAGMVGVLLQKYPQMVPELMAYQATIIKCSRDFEGLVGPSMIGPIGDRWPRLKTFAGLA